MSDQVMMPDGTPFPFWDDVTQYRQVYHVAREHPRAADDGPGTEERPFATIGQAAKVLQPGEKVVVHQGIYRECVRPARGGTGPEAMIAYEAAPGEEVSVRGSQPWNITFTPSEGGTGKLPEGVTVWTGEMPAEWFVGYNPSLARNVCTESTPLSTIGPVKRPECICCAAACSWRMACRSGSLVPAELAVADGVF